MTQSMSFGNCNNWEIFFICQNFSKFLNLNVSGTNWDVVPKQRYDKFPSVGDHVHATPTFEHAWATLGHTVIGGF